MNRTCALTLVSLDYEVDRTFASAKTYVRAAGLRDGRECHDIGKKDEKSRRTR